MLSKNLMDSINGQNFRALSSYVESKAAANTGSVEKNPTAKGASQVGTLKSYAKDGMAQKIVQLSNATKKLYYWTAATLAGANLKEALQTTKTDSALAGSTLATGLGAYSQFYKYESTQQGVQKTEVTLAKLQKEHAHIDNQLHEQYQRLNELQSLLNNDNDKELPLEIQSPQQLHAEIHETNATIKNLVEKSAWLDSKISIAGTKKDIAVNRLQQTRQAAAATTFKSTNVLLKLATRFSDSAVDYGAKSVGKGAMGGAMAIGLPIFVQGIYRELGNLHKQYNLSTEAISFIKEQRSDDAQTELQAIAKQISRNQPTGETWMNLGIHSCKTLGSLIGLTGLAGLSSFAGLQVGLEPSVLPTALEPFSWVLAGTAAGLGSIGLSLYKSHRESAKQAETDYWLNIFAQATQGSPPDPSELSENPAFTKQQNLIAQKHKITDIATLSDDDKLMLNFMVADKAHKKLLKNDPMYAACFLLDRAQEGDETTIDFLNKFPFTDAERYIIEYAKSDQELTEAAQIIMQRLGLV